MRYSQSPRKRFADNGYTTIHLFGEFWLVRNYPRKARRFSLYGLMRFRKEDDHDPA